MTANVCNNTSSCDHLINRFIISTSGIALTALSLGIPTLIFSHQACQKAQSSDSIFSCSDLGPGTALTAIGFAAAIPAITLLTLKIFCLRREPDEANANELSPLV